MKKIILFFICSIFWCTNVLAEPITQMVFFGDSLTDNGNFYNKYGAKKMPKSPPYFAGRFSNGSTWAEQLGDIYHSRYGINYEIYAVGGATAVLRNPVDGYFPLSLKDEITDYLAHTALTDVQHTLFVLWIGANDYAGKNTQSLETIVSGVINTITANIQILLHAGAKHFLILNLPDFSKTPGAQKNPTTISRLHALSELHEQKMRTLIENLTAQHPDIQFILFDTNALFSDLTTHIEKYNQKYNMHIANTTDACWVGGYLLQGEHEQTALVRQLEQMTPNQTALFTAEARSNYILNSPMLAAAYQVSTLHARGIAPCADADQYLFWDALHPSAVLHRILANSVEEILTPQIMK